MRKYIILICGLIINSGLTAQKTAIHFESDNYTISSTSSMRLDSVVDFLQRVKDYKITIAGYCDNTGNETKNQLLSEKRSSMVAEYLAAKHLDPAKITANGFSSKDPVGPNTSEQGKAMNRRAEITINFTLPELIAPVAPVVEQQKKQPEPTVMAKPGELSNTMVGDSLKVGEILILKNLNFEGGTAQLLPESKPSLKALLKLLKENPTMEIEIEGHVCCANDMALSVDRALTVLEYLVRNGIAEKRLKYAGHSNYNPIANESTEPGRISNRRVEIMILKK